MGEGAWLVAFLIVQRLAELGLAQRNTARLRAAGAIEFGAAHYPLMVVLHGFWLLGLWMLGHDHSVDPLWLAVFILLQAGRLWVIVSLDRRWTTRVIVLPGASPVARGPYRWLRHPNYVVVVLEIAVVPLALGLPLFALVFSLANAVLLAYRIRVENQALAWAALATSNGGSVKAGTVANGYASSFAPSVRTAKNDLRMGTERGVVMKGFVQDIEGLAVKNSEFRRVLYTAKHCQLVVMALKPKEEIGAEVHKLDQFFRVEEGTGEAVLDGVRTAIKAGFAVVVPAGTKHNIINTGNAPLKLYTLYAPPNHRDGVVHHTRADAEADNEHFDGKTTE